MLRFLRVVQKCGLHLKENPRLRALGKGMLRISCASFGRQE